MTGEKLKAIREKLGLSQDEFAGIFGLAGRSTISHFETDFRTPNLLFQAMMDLLDGLSDRKAADLLELIREHVAKVKRQAKSGLK